ncbi:MAG: rubrerythrin [Candidatus Lambdaproteobacteria bacterium RIFOXYD12_FULL_49_8]|uniref:Rubrerythrin n=1 Tax=Candidatus Lambdaproteobacteria bacterium RIFOXYD2_FULL_50_16 TaxID=1817772 RepID=A0A1F6GAF0_9PROT|nr:MAG: rubrerythrin [Candidatus Lambdaproteobacteria bacterium RIFOXYD2_FULL_50_16]OGG98007.1 MAG: rubrerythrin [Candidatus Lambdaproteobacteria bacterium RIFOXYD12_FULL_49_8]
MKKTEKNLKDAFAGESQARNKYTYFAKVAQKEGHHGVAAIFEETALNEMRHAKDEFLLLGGLGDTVSNLKAAISGEDYEVKKMYPTMAKEAEEEGNKEAAKLFKQIAKIEEHHRDRFQRLLDLLEAEKLYEREEAIDWKCNVCGHIHHGKKAPGKCPTCGHPQGHFLPSDIF